MSHYRNHRSRKSAAAKVAPVQQLDEPTPTSAHAPERELLLTLVGELLEAEHSARLHSTREAQRLGDAPPSVVLRAVGEHAARALPELMRLAARTELPFSAAALTLGSVFSSCREFVADHLTELVDPERSYRGTLLGVRHGVDLVELLVHVARAQGQGELSQWCSVWLQERRPLVDEMVRSLKWFAQNPEKATSRPVTHKLTELWKSLMPQTRRPDAAAAH